jgi:hypothetical protein
MIIFLFYKDFPWNDPKRIHGEGGFVLRDIFTLNSSNSSLRAPRLSVAPCLSQAPAVLRNTEFFITGPFLLPTKEDNKWTMELSQCETMFYFLE